MIAREGRDVGGAAANSGSGGAEPAAVVECGGGGAGGGGSGAAAARGDAGRGAARGSARGSAANPAPQGLNRAEGKPRDRGHVHLPAGERGGLLRDGGRAGQVSGGRRGRGEAPAGGKRAGSGIRGVKLPSSGAPGRPRVCGAGPDARPAPLWGFAVPLRCDLGPAWRCGPYMAPRGRERGTDGRTDGRQRGGAGRGGGAELRGCGAASSSTALRGFGGRERGLSGPEPAERWGGRGGQPQPHPLG